MALTGLKTRTDSLICRANRLYRGNMEQSAGPEPAAPPFRCADGYLRITPVQPYRTPEGYRQKKLRKLLGVLVLVALLGLAVWAVISSGIIRRVM